MCLKERCLDVSLEQNKKIVFGGKDITMNCIRHLMNQILLAALK